MIAFNRDFCQHDQHVKKFGKDRKGNQRYRCLDCGKTWTEQQVKPIGNLRIDTDKAVFALRLLLEGTGIRPTERLTGLHRDTLCDLVLTVGQNCEAFLNERLVDLEVSDIECDELWGFVGMKEKTRQRLDRPEEFGDAYCFVAIERTSKLVVTWHLGKRTNIDCWEFINNLRLATSGRFQVSTDGYGPYQSSIPLTFQFGIDFAQIIKSYGGSSDTEPERKYSPANIASVKTTIGCGSPDEDRICTSYVERSNLSMRMHLRRLTRLTNAHSKSLPHHRAMLALYFAWYNFVRKHMTLGTTPAVAQGLTDHVWTVDELLTEAAKGADDSDA